MKYEVGGMRVKVGTWEMKAGDGSGRHVRIATRVLFEDGNEIRFTEKLTNREAIRNACYQLAIHGITGQFSL
jgi:hypothetical protein